jgi:hypothetical protein
MTMGYVFQHEGAQYAPDGRVEVANVDEHNAQLERAELALWAQQPDRWAVYIVKNPKYDPNALGVFNERKWIATTWKGTKIGDVTKSSTHKRYTANSIYSMRTVHITGTNGAYYYGRYGSDWAQLCRIRKVK